jgi:FkbM family methyltransferase
VKILWHSVAPWVPTGYGQQTGNFTPRLAALGHDVVISGHYGLRGMEMMWRGLRVLPGYAAQYGTDVLVTHAMSHFADKTMRRFEEGAANGLVITLADSWVLDVPLLRDLCVAAWTPVDHETMPPVLRQWFELVGAVPVAMSRFGERVMAEAGLSPLYVPHGIDVGVFHPGDQAEARERAGLPLDAFVIAMVANNMGNDVARKGFAEQIEAFRMFRRTHSDAMLILHTDVDCPMGVHIREMIEGLPDGSVRYCDQYAYRMGMPAEAVADVYRSADLLTNCSYGEGFGVPIVEAQACGVPVVVTDTTSMPELCGSGWKVPGERFWHDPMRAWGRRPYVEDILYAYNQAYDKARTEAMQSKAWAFAQQYNADTVTEKYWVPVLERLDAALAERRAALWAPPDPAKLKQTLRAVDGLLWIDRGKGTDDWVAVSDHEETLTPVMEKHLPYGGVFLDVGAHIGRWSLRMAHRAHKVFAVEPNPAARTQLNKHIAINDIHNVEVLPFAAWDENVTLVLDDPNHRLSGGSTRTLRIDPDATAVIGRDDEPEPVQGVRLDTIEDLVGLSRIDLVKLDVEGSDLHALRGMANLLAKFKPALIIECHDLYGYYTRQELHDVLRSLDYSWGPVERFHTAEYLVCHHDGREDTP